MQIATLSCSTLVCRAIYGLLVLLLASVSCLALAEHHDSQKVPTMSVRGQSILQVKPDQLSMSLGVTSQAASAKQALAANNKKMQAIIRAVKRLGLKEDEYQTQYFQVHPVWSQRPRKSVNEEWRPSIVAYRVNNSLTVRTPKLSSAGEIIANATEAGADQVNAINFGLADPRKYRAQAIEQAMQNAQSDASALAKAAGDRIKRRLTLSLDNAVATPYRVQHEKAMMRSAAMVADASMAPPIEAGDVSVNASVSVVYELE